MGKFSEKYDLNKAKLLKQLIEKSYKKGNFTLSSGKKSSHYLNCKPVSLNGEGLNLISHLFLELTLASRIHTKWINLRASNKCGSSIVGLFL